MKTVVFKAVVPDDEIDNLMLTDSSGTLPFSIIPRPTEEEIEIMAKAKPVFSGHISNRKIGALWMRDRILGEEKPKSEEGGKG